jgi:competence protein ComGC
MKRLRTQHGLGAMGLLLSLLILGLLIFVFAKSQVRSGKEAAAGSPMTALDKGRAAACQAQRRSIERDIVAWSVDHDNEAPSIAALEAAGFRVPACPEGGTYSISGRHVECSVHR